MQQIEALSPAELAQHHRDVRIERRMEVRAQEKAVADPCPTYRCSGCAKTFTALDVALYGRDCDCGWLLIGQPVVKLSNPKTGSVAVTLKARYMDGMRQLLLSRLGVQPSDLEVVTCAKHGGFITYTGLN